MQYNNLGKSKLKVSELGFGSMSLTGKDLNNDVLLIQQAYDLGINYFDTADIYADGANEALVGKAVKGFRKDIVLATKVGNVRRQDHSGLDWDVSKDYINEAIDKSLKRLDTDYIDLYQVHGGTIEDNKDEVIESLERLKEIGKIRTYGISSIRPNVFQYYVKHGVIVSNMMQYSVLDTRPEEFFCVFQDNDVSVIARGVLAQGLLLEKPSISYLNQGIGKVRRTKEKLEEIARLYGVSNLAVALVYVLKNKAVSSALIGVRTNEQLETLMHAYLDMEKITANKLENIGAYSQYTAHRD